MGIEPSLSAFPCLRELQGILEAAGYHVDKENIGMRSQSDNEERDLDRIRACRAVLMVVTSATRTDPRYQRAWEQAIHEHKPIIQLVCGETDVPERLRVYEAIEFTECRTAAVQRLLDVLEWVHSPEYERLRRNISTRITAKDGQPKKRRKDSAEQD